MKKTQKTRKTVVKQAKKKVAKVKDTSVVETTPAETVENPKKTASVVFLDR